MGISKVIYDFKVEKKFSLNILRNRALGKQRLKNLIDCVLKMLWQLHLNLNAAFVFVRAYLVFVKEDKTGPGLLTINHREYSSRAVVE